MNDNQRGMGSAVNSAGVWKVVFLAPQKPWFPTTSLKIFLCFFPWGRDKIQNLF